MFDDDQKQMFIYDIVVVNKEKQTITTDRTKQSVFPSKICLLIVA
jgi:hypothetical protein